MFPCDNSQMSLNSSWVDFARTLNLKVGSNGAFGALNGQYVYVSKTQRGYEISFLLKEETKEIIRSIFNSKQSLKITGSRFHRYEISEILKVTSIQPRLTSAGNNKHLSEVLSLVIEKLGHIQSFPAATSSATILIDGVPAPAEWAAQKKITRQSDINLTKGLLGIPISLGLGILLGIVSVTLKSKLGFDLPTILKATLSLTMGLGIYKSLSGAIIGRSRIPIAFSSSLLFFIWELTTAYYSVTNESGIEITVGEAFLFFIRQIHSFSKGAVHFLIGFFSIWGLSLFGLKRLDSPTVIEEGRIITPESMEEVRTFQKSYGAFIFLVVVSFAIGVALSFYGGIHLNEITYVSIFPWIGAGILSFSVIFLSSLYFFRRYNVFHYVSLAKISNNSQHPSTSLFLVSLALSGGFSLFLSGLNVQLDTNSPRMISATVMEDYPSTTNQCQQIEFAKKSSEIRFDYWVCQSQYNALTKGDSVYFKKFSGIFNVPYLKEMTVPVREELKKAIEQGLRLSSVRANHIRDFVKYDKSSYFREQVSNWEAGCTRGLEHMCRVSGYVAKDEGRDEDWRKFMTKGCYDSRDPLSCRNLIADKKLGTMAFKHLKKECSNGENKFCIEWAWSLPRETKEDLNIIRSIFSLACDRGDEEACKFKEEYSSFQ